MDEIYSVREEFRQYNEMGKELAFFKRYLKEHGAYAAYRRNIHDEKCYNVWQEKNPDWSFKNAVEHFGVKLLITKLITWNNTSEGWDYWNKMHQDFYRLYDEKFGHKK
jgi:hypothetical protein